MSEDVSRIKLPTPPVMVFTRQEIFWSLSEGLWSYEDQTWHLKAMCPFKFHMETSILTFLRIEISRIMNPTRKKNQWNNKDNSGKFPWFSVLLPREAVHVIFIIIWGLKTRKMLMKYTAFGPSFAVHWTQETLFFVVIPLAMSLYLRVVLMLLLNQMKFPFKTFYIFVDIDCIDPLVN